MEISNPALAGVGLEARLEASEWTEWRARRLRNYLAKQAEITAETAARAALRARLDAIDAGEDAEANASFASAYDRMTARLEARGDDGVWEECAELWEDLGSAQRRVRDMEVEHKATYLELWIENALKAEQYHGEYRAYRKWQAKHR